MSEQRNLVRSVAKYVFGSLIRVITHRALCVCERAEPDFLQRGGPRRGGVRLPAEVVAPSPSRGRRRRRLGGRQTTEARVRFLGARTNS